jgi:hypothetical protein
MKIKGPTTTDPLAQPSASGPAPTRSFKEVSGAETTPGTQGAAAQVVADLKAGRLSPDQAVERLVHAAVQRQVVPPAVRARVEVRVREALARDPVLGSLLRNLGAHVPTEDE